jgi:DNA polymerase-4
MNPRLVLHADMDAFYASIEQRDRPELRGLPVIVGAAGARGVVAAASYEARRFGVRSAMPGFRARELCPDAVFLPSNMELYVSVSEAVHSVLARFSPDIEPIALDEAFVDVTSSAHLFGGPLELGRRLKREVREAVGLPISVGIGPSKLVAKLACTLGKPDGFLFVPQEAVEWLLDPLPVRRIWGVGPVLDETLAKFGIRTIRELRSFDPASLVRAIGDRALALQRLAQGHDDRAVESDLDPRSYGEENTFPSDVHARDVVTSALTAHAEAVARRLRRDGFRGHTVTLKIKLGRARGHRVSRLDGEMSEPIYPLLSRQKTLAGATDDGGRIRDVAVALWDSAGIGEPVRLLGVSVSNLVPGAERDGGEQLELFGPKRQERQEGAPREESRLGVTLDAITDRFGVGAIRRAVDAPEKATATNRKKRGE